MPVAAPSQQPFVNHFADLLGKRKGIDESLKAGINLAAFAEWGLLFSETTERASVYCAQASVGLGLARSVIKLADIVDDIATLSDALFVPDTLQIDRKFVCNVIEGIGLGGADLISIPIFLDQMGLTELEEKAEILGCLGKSCALVGLGASVFKSVADMDVREGKLHRRRTQLAAIIEAQQSLEHRESDVDPENLAAERDRLERCIVKQEAWHQRGLLSLIEAIIDIVGIIFGFFAAGFSLPLVIAAPILSLLGMGSAFSGLWKLWIETTALGVVA